MTGTARTNALTFRPNLEGIVPPSWPVRFSSYLHRVKRHVLREVDDFDWSTYEQHYGPQNEIEAKNFSYDLADIDYHVASGRIFTVADAKPVHPLHRALFEAILNLPPLDSLHEIGTGGGKLIVNLGYLLGPGPVRGASDIGSGQLALFERRWPDAWRTVKPFIHDITESPLPTSTRADLVLVATVLMHIKRREAYHSALKNLLRSANKYLVLAENWGAHDYVEELRRVAREQVSHKVSFYCYDSGAAVTLVVPLTEEKLPECFESIDCTAALRRYG